MHIAVEYSSPTFQWSFQSSDWRHPSTLLLRGHSSGLVKLPLNKYGIQQGVSNRWTGFSTGTWDWNVELEHGTGMWDNMSITQAHFSEPF